MLKHRARSLNQARVYPIGALTVGLAGQSLTEMAELREAGCVAFSQADIPLVDTELLWRAMQYAGTFGISIWLRATDAHVGRNGIAHDGEIATRLGLAGIPVLAETIALSTIVALVRDTGVRMHVCRISSAESVALVRAAKREGLPVTCDVAIHHLHLCDVDIGWFDPNARLVPPLRGTRDRAALRAGRRRRHHRRGVLGSRARRRRRQAGAFRRGGAGRHRPRAPASADAQVGERGRRAVGRARSRASRARPHASWECRQAPSTRGRPPTFAFSIPARGGKSSARRCAARARTRRSSGSRCRGSVRYTIVARTGRPRIVTLIGGSRVNEAIESHVRSLTGDRNVDRRTFVVTSLGAGFAAFVAAGAGADHRHFDRRPGRRRSQGEDARRRDAGVPRHARDRQQLPGRARGEEVCGVHEYIKDVSRRLAKDGFFAIAPELYARQGNARKLHGHVEARLAKSWRRRPTSR